MDPVLDNGGSATGEVSAGEVRRTAIIGGIAIATTTSRFYVLSFMTTYAISTLHMNAVSSYAPSALVGAILVIASPLNGLLSDLIGRKPVMLGCSTLFLLAVYPVFAYMADQRTMLSLLIGTGILAILFPTGNTLAVTEGLPRRVRSTSLGVAYGISGVLAGTTTQAGVQWLINVTKDPVAPAYFLIGTTILGITVMSMLRETAPVRIQPIRNQR
jgi:MFS family permease